MKYVLLLSLSLLSLPTLAFFNRDTAPSKNTVTITENNYVLFEGEVGPASVGKVQVQLAEVAARLSSNEPLYLIIDSPGGSIDAGNKFIDFAKGMHRNIKPVCLFCASMGYHMFQNFGERLVSTTSELMSHRASLGGLVGQVPGEFETRLNAIKATLLEMDTRIAKRVGTSVEAYRQLTYNELWLSGTEAVRTKHADRIVQMRCSQELLKATFTQEVKTWIGTVVLTKSKCPLVSYPITAKLRGSLVINGKVVNVSVNQLIGAAMKVKQTVVKFKE